MDRRSRSTSLRKDHIRHVTISSSSSSSRSRSRNRNRNRSRSLSSRSRSRSGSRRRSRRRRRSKKRRRSSSKSRSKSRSKSKSKSRRSRSLSSSKNELKRTGYLGTNSRDPKMVASRIFIGNLPMSDVSKEDLEAIYGRYGKILDVKLATEGRGRPPGSKPDDEREMSPTWRAGREPAGYLPPRPPGPPLPPGVGGYRQPPLAGPPLHGAAPPGSFFGPPLPGPFPRGPLPPPDHFRRNPFPEPFPGEHFPPDFPPRVGFPPHPPSMGRPPPVPSPPSVDCEILILDVKQSLYADTIKKRLLAAGIVTGINVVIEVDVPLALEDAARRRLLFAIIVNEQNEVHRSITVNILHGIPQEHRNMPLDDAITLITRSYDKYMLERKERLGALAPPASGPPGPSHPEEFLPAGPRVQYLLNLLADRRFLTIAELTVIMDYLEERRRLLVLSQEKNRSQPLGRELERRKPEMLSADIPESRRSFDIDDRERLPIGLPEGSRDRLVHSAELNTERMAVADLSRERYAVGDASRERVSVDRDRAAQMDLTGSVSVESSRIADYDRPATNSSSGQAPEISIAKILSTSINFDNPSVKQALDNLMSGGPSLFRSVSDAVGQKVSGIGGKYPEGDGRF